MDDDEKIAHLTAALDQPEGKYTHDQIRQKLVEIHGKREAASVGALHDDSANPEPGPDVHLQPNPKLETPGGFAQRMGDKAAPAARAVGSFANRALNTATFGMTDAAENGIANFGGPRIGDSPDERGEFQQKHPWMAGAADAAGYLAPEGLPARAAAGVARGVDELTNALVRRKVVTTPVQRIAAKTAGSAAASMGTAGVVRGAEALAGGEDPSQAGRDAADAATSPAAVLGGAAFGAASGTAGEAAAAARRASPDLSILAKHGLEPGPIPGRPVIRMDQPIAKQLPGVGEPPLGVSNVTPGTRGAAARQAGDVIRGDLDARESANNRRFGELKDEALNREGGNPAPFGHIVNGIDTALSDQSLSDATRKGLMDVRGKFEPFIPKTSPQIQHVQGMLQNASASSKPALQNLLAQLQRQAGGAPAPFTAADLDEIRRYMQTKISSGEIHSGDVEFMKLYDAAKNTLAKPGVAPSLAALNASHHEIMNGFEQRRALLGESENPGRGPYADERQGRAIAGRIQQGGEETATGGRGTTDEGHATERLGALGAPATHPGAAVPAFDPNYRARLEVPRLQLAQENLQLSASKPWSGAGSASELGLPSKMLKFAPARVGYPLARRFGEAPVGTKPIAGDALIQALRSRKQKGDVRNAD